MKKIIVIAMVLMFVITMFSANVSGNAMGDENYSDHSSNDTQPGSGDLGPGEPSANEDANPSEDRTRNKDA
ncbi:MAG: hypothetical protein AB3K77_07470 [Methanosarcinaceae archaeon]